MVLEQLGTPNLTLKEEQRKSVEAVNQGKGKEILCLYGYQQDLARAFATELSHS